MSLDSARVRHGGRQLYVNAIVGVSMWTQALERRTVLHKRTVGSELLWELDVPPVGNESYNEGKCVDLSVIS